MHTYDLFGWYAADLFPQRDAGVAQPNLSQTTIPGELRANWTGYVWEMHPYVVPQEPTPPVVVDARICVGGLFDRFGDQKIPILASADPVVQAIIKDATVRQYITLTSADLARSLDILIGKGFAVDKERVLSLDITEEERP